MKVCYAVDLPFLIDITCLLPDKWLPVCLDAHLADLIYCCYVLELPG